MGLPVITTAIGGIPDIVEPGQTGFLIQPGDPRELAAALSRTVDDDHLRVSMGAAGRERVLTRFDARLSAARLVDLARTLHADRRGVKHPVFASPEVA